MKLWKCLKKLHNSTLHNTILAINYFKKESYRKHYGKWGKCWLPAFSPFPIMFSTLSQAKICDFKLPSTIALNKCTILLFGKELTLYPLIHYYLYLIHSTKLTNPKQKISRPSKLKEFSEANSKYLINIAESSPKGYKKCGKRINNSLGTNSPFPKGFSKDFNCRHVTTAPHAGANT